MKVFRLLLLAVLLTSCSYFHHGGGTVTPPPNPIPIVGVDPTISWNPVTTACNGHTLSGVTYSVYIQPSTGSIPTKSTSIVGCTGTFNIVDTTKVTATTTNVSGTSYNSTVGVGSYIVVVEAVAATVQGIASTQTAFQVQDVPSAVGGVQVSWAFNPKKVDTPQNLKVR